MELYKRAYPTVTKQKQYKSAMVTVKGDSHLYESKVLELKTKAAQAQTSIMAKKLSLFHQKNK